MRLGSKVPLTSVPSATIICCGMATNDELTFCGGVVALGKLVLSMAMATLPVASGGVHTKIGLPL